MGRVWLLLVAAVWCSGARAQDVILLRNAEEIRAEVREVTDTHLIYRLWDGPDEVLMLPRSEVFSVTYRNGTQDFFMTDRAVSAAAEYPWPAVTKSYRPGDLFDEDGVRGLVISVTDGGRHGLLLSLDQAELPWVGEANRQILAGTVEMISGWTEVRYAYHGGVALGTTDCSDGWNNRLRLLEALPSIGFALSDYPAFAPVRRRGRGREVQYGRLRCVEEPLQCLHGPLWRGSLSPLAGVPLLVVDREGCRTGLWRRCGVPPGGRVALAPETLRDTPLRGGEQGDGLERPCRA